MGLTSKKKRSLLGMAETILNCMDAFIYVSDLHTNEVLFLNGRMKEHLHVGDDVLGGTCWKVFQKGLTEPCSFCPLPRLMKNQDEPVIWEDYNTITSHIYRNISRIIDWPDGRQVHMLHATDITDNRHAEEALKRQLEQQELMSSISQSLTTTRDIKDLIFEALKMSGEFMRVNHSFLAVYRKDEGCLECISEWHDDESQPFIGGQSKWPISPDMEIYRDLTENGYAAVSDYSLLTHPYFQAVKDYDLRAFLNVPVEVCGEFWGIIGVIINNQAHDWSESDIHLGKLIAGVFSGAVGRGIAEKNLCKAKEDAERASRSKGDFLSSMSHEIRTPLNAVIGMTQIARNSGDPQKKEYCLERIDSASKHLLGLINDILDMSKIEANKIDLSDTEFDLEVMLINVTSMVNFKVEEKKQNLIINIDSEVPSVLIGDELRLSQTITNLLSNAVKFTPEDGSITVNIRSQGIADGVCTLLVEVIDTGIGISKEQQTRLFSPFEQADKSTTRKYGGTGLGLPICKGIVEIMGGHIWIESELGEGSKFSFTVPLKVGCEARKPKSVAIASRDDIHILAVDDAPEIREYFQHVMPALDLSCDVADSGESALEMIRQNKDKQYNIFFVNWMMSGLDGVDLVKKIKQLTQENAVIIMIPAADWSSVEKDATAAGADGFISKPLFPSVLINAINASFGMAMVVKSTRDNTCVYDFSGYNLLIVEDIEINREIISAILEDSRVSIDFACNGLEAVCMFEKNADKYSLILMDIQMPEIDGYEATRRIRALDLAAAKTIPIIAMTANVFQEDIEKCIQTGMNDHIGKPVDSNELLLKICKALPI